MRWCPECGCTLDDSATHGGFCSACGWSDCTKPGSPVRSCWLWDPQEQAAKCRGYAAFKDNGEG